MTNPSATGPTTAGAEESPRLNELYFYLTAGCNLACRHCWLAPKLDVDGTKYPTLPVALFEQILDEARPLGLSAVKLTGGEPLLHPQIERLLDAVRERELPVQIETNGVLCTQRMAAAIAKNPSRFVSISIDGVDAATHDGVRGVPGSFELALRAVNNLVEAGISPQVILSIMRCNVDQVEPMVRLAEKIGACSVKFNVIQPSARGEQLYAADRAVGVAELIELGRRVDTELAPTTRLPLHFDLPPAFRPLGAFARGDGCGACNILGILGVLPTGQYALCGVGENIPELVFGRAGIDSLASVWRDNATLRMLREGVPDRLEGVCADCLMRHRCLGGCIAQNYYDQRKLFAPFWLCEQARRAGTFPASRLAGRRSPAQGGRRNGR